MRPHIRLAIAVWVSFAVIAATMTINSQTATATHRSGADALKKAYAATAANAVAKKSRDLVVYHADGTHTHLAGTLPHDHNNPATKNSVTRVTPAEADGDISDPTTADQAAANEQAAAAQREEADPPLTHVPVDPPQPAVPTDRYNLFNACYGLQSTLTHRWLQGTTPAFTAADNTASIPLYFKPTDLGRYLLYTPSSTYLGNVGTLGSKLGYATSAGPEADWTVTQVAPGAFRLFLPGSGYLAVSGTQAATFVALPSAATELAPVRRGGCTPFPEISTNVEGDPAAGVTSFQETRGYVDGHMHGMAFEFLGGDLHCGRPWSPWGVQEALAGCSGPNSVTESAVESFLAGKPETDPVGWPTFKQWPAPDALTHEGTYYKWIERSWLAGQRMMVNLLVENNQLCMIYPFKHNSCDDMKSVRLQASDMYKLQDYVDAQHGGPGKGWYRIVTDPAQAREVINAGKMAVIMGIETSVLFGCHVHFGIPTCTAASIQQQLDEVKKMGVVQMELVNKFDNALAGVAGDEGTTGFLVNAANTLETGSPWRMQTCHPNDPEIHDKDQDNSAPIPSQDALFGAILQVVPSSIANVVPQIPLYPAKHHCNNLGLSDLGADVIKGMAARNMIFDPDHMSVKARKASLDLVDAIHYPGVVSSHSWSTPDAYPRIYGEGGFITPYAGDSTGFVAKWKRHLTWANPANFWGFGYGSDINGLGAQGNARAAAATDHPVTYPFTGLGGVRAAQQARGHRASAFKTTGVRPYGSSPDWIQD